MDKGNKLTLCLNMIVKNESDIIYDTLENICSKLSIDYWVICDTGSTDDTINIIKNFFKNKNIKGELHQIPWKNFEYNRTKALELAYKKTDFLLVFDADDRITGNIDISTIEKGYAYKLIFKTSNFEWNRISLIDNSLKWYYEGVLHEYITTKDKYVEEILLGDYIINTNMVKSARNKKNLNKFLDDAKILEEGIKKKDKLYSRYLFYCAQSYKNGKKEENAIKRYKDVLNANGWVQEKYISCYELGKIYESINEWEKAFYYYTLSYEYDDTRYECFYEIIKKFRLEGKYKLANAYYKFLKPFNKLGKLFLVNNIYEYLMKFELTILSYYVKEYQIAIDSYKFLFKNSSKIPNNILAMMATNLKWYITKVDMTDDEFFDGYTYFTSICLDRDVFVPYYKLNK